MSTLEVAIVVSVVMGLIIIIVFGRSYYHDKVEYYKNMYETVSVWNEGLLEENRKLKESYEAYIKLLGEEIDELSSFATIHGWKSTRAEKGAELRSKIGEIKKPYTDPYSAAVDAAAKVIENVYSVVSKIKAQKKLEQLKIN